MIDIQDLYKSFNGKPVLQGLNLNIPKGEGLVLIGASGSGKSVLMKCILGLELSDRGTIKVDGKPAKPAQFLDKFGMLFQGAALFDSLPVWENVAFRLLHSGLNRTEAKMIAISKLDRVGLSANVGDQWPSELSGGMRKRVGLARAIAHDPELIFFDEPTTGLDPIRANTINRLIRDVVEELGATTLTITHDMSSAYAIADRVAMLSDGKIVWEGSPAKMKSTKNKSLLAFINGEVRT